MLYEQLVTPMFSEHRDHVVHSVNVLLLGIYLLKHIFPPKLDEKVDWPFQWKLASLLHDIGYTHTLNNEMTKRKEEKTGVIANEKPKIRDFDLGSITKSSFEAIDECLVNADMAWAASTELRNAYDGFDQDHGIYGSLVILKEIDELYANNNNKGMWDRKYFKNDIISICTAIYLHGIRTKSFKCIERDVYPLAYLLRLTDCLQDWGRPSGIGSGEKINDYFYECSSPNVGELLCRVPLHRKEGLEQDCRVLIGSQIKFEGM